jgi:tetratricopeptide (TPR) repeat protein
MGRPGVNLQRGAQSAGAPNRQQRRQAARQDKKAPRGSRANPDLDDMLRQAVAQQEAGRPRDALEIYRQILTRRPDNLEALNGVGLAAFHMGDYALTIRLLQAVIARKPDYAEAHSNLGIALAIAGRKDEALAAYRRAIEIAPRYAHAHYNLGATLQAAGRFEASKAAYLTAIALRPTHVESYTNLAAVLYEIGDLGTVETTCRQAIALRPNDPLAHTYLGLALLAGGARDEAESALRRAVEVGPSYGRAHYYLGQILFREHDPQPAARCFEEALRVDPTLGVVHLFLGIAYDLRGETAAAARQFDALARHPGITDYLIDSWTYVKSNRAAGTRLLSDSFETLRYALDCAQVDGLAVEFGVRFGTSLNFLAGHLAQEVHGFDSFQGLPEAWNGIEPGLYATGGRLPQVGANVRLHVGLFADTLPGFAAEHPGPIRFMNVDCDIYSSTKTIFDHLAERIVPGTVIVFDEYLTNPNWREDEFKAFQEAVRGHAWKYEYLAFNLFSKQAVVRIL